MTQCLRVYHPRRTNSGIKSTAMGTCEYPVQISSAVLKINYCKSGKTLLLDLLAYRIYYT